MDWTAQMLGLDKSFYNTTEVGGGVIQVCLILLSLHQVIFKLVPFTRRRHRTLH